MAPKFVPPCKTKLLPTKVKGPPATESTEAKVYAAFGLIVLQFVAVDLVFSIDSIVTAIGMAQDIEIMIAAVVIAVGVMYVASGPVAHFVAEHPTTKMLALSFLLLIGAALIADGFHFHIPRAYLYFAMAFSAGVEAVNVIAMRNRRKSKPAKGRGEVI